MSKNKPLASLSLDLDNQWSYMKTHGDPNWESLPSYLDLVVPRVLDFLKKRDLQITFFVVGQDAACEQNHAALKMISDAGHEIGNHSFKHEPWLHLYTEDEIEADLTRAQEAIEQVTGQRPIGFRGPGYSLSTSTLRVLKRMGYKYDCSTLPTYMGPLARAYYFMTTRLSAEEKEQRKKLFGTLREGLRPVKPYYWQIDDTQMIEVPVTTMPLFKIPIHASYVLYLGKFSPVLAKTYFRIALTMCRLTGVQPSILLHPLDFVSSEDVSALDFFPAMQVKTVDKLRLMSWIIDTLNKQYQVVPMRQHAQAITEQKQTPPVLEPHFSIG